MQSEAPPCTKVPTVDLGELGVHHAEEPSQQEWDRVMHEIDHAFSSIGCAYLTGHGVPDHLVNEMLSCGADFFKMDKDAKIRWAEDRSIYGYTLIDSERYGGAGPELHETFLINSHNISDRCMEVLPFMTPLVSLHQHIHVLSRRLLTTFALSVGKNTDYFMNMHRDRDTKKSTSYYSMNYYPMETNSREDVTGLGAHVDSTSFTFLFSNVRESFQICDSAGQWMDVPFVPGTVLLIAGEFLHNHSNKRIKAPMHRVVVPREHQPGRPPRISMGYFLYPDEHLTLWPPSDDTTSPAPPLVKEFVEEKVRAARIAAKSNW